MKGSAATEESSLVSSLAARIAGLEAALGYTPDQLSILTMETGKKNLTAALQVLSSKTAMMDPGKLDHIEGTAHTHFTLNTFLSVISQVDWEFFSRSLEPRRRRRAAWTVSGWGSWTR